MSDFEYVGRTVVARWNTANYARVITIGMKHPGVPRAPSGWSVLAHGASRNHAVDMMRETARELAAAADAMEADDGP